jgi:hypothetical protein
MEKRLWRGVRREWGNEGEVGKCDLKAGHGRPSSSVFDRTVLAVNRTRAWAGGARPLRSNLQGEFDRKRA